ncbi:MAG TPA: hypothetical protein DCF91_12000 [Porphyromonadaceae bacterium]|nr:hypothetical protein [Porphyromonadaceae bacterium]
MKHIGTVLVFLILAVSCKNEDVTFAEPVFPEIYRVDARILNDDFMFRHGYQPHVYDSLLIVGNMSDKDIICIFNKNTGALIESLGQLGNGPYELITPIAFSVNRSSGYLYVNDYGRKDILQYDLNKIVRGTEDYVTAIRLSEDSKDRNNFLFVKDSLFISNGFADRVALVSPSQIKDKIEACSAVVGFESPQTWNQFMSSYSCNAVSPDGKKFASATLIGGIVELYSIDGDNIKEGRKKLFYEPIFDKKGMAYNPTPETIYGFCHLSVTDAYLYATAHAKVNPTTMPNTIWKFDWKGNPIASYTCKYPIENFTVDEAAGKAFAVVYTDAGEQALAVIDLKGRV